MTFWKLKLYFIVQNYYNNKYESSMSIKPYLISFHYRAVHFEIESKSLKFKQITYKTLKNVYFAISDEVQRQLTVSDVKIIVTIPEITDVVKNAMKMAKLDLPIVVIRSNDSAVPEGTIAFNELSENVNVDLSCLKEVRRTAKDLCFLPYSSGTTGVPKGVQLTNANIISNCDQINEPIIMSHNETTGKVTKATVRILINYQLPQNFSTKTQFLRIDVMMFLLLYSCQEAKVTLHTHTHTLISICSS